MFICCTANAIKSILNMVSYIDSSDSIKNEKPTVNPINKKDNKCFQYAATVALNHEENKKYLQGTSKVKLYLDKYDWAGIRNKLSIWKSWLEIIWEK